MLCPRCNSENEMGAKFCRHCGAPLTDTELFMSPKEKKMQAKNLKRQQKMLKKQQQNQNKINTVSKRTYTLNEKKYRRNYVSVFLNFIKSLIILAIVLVAGYYLGKFLLTKVAENTKNYTISGRYIPSINYIIGDRDVKEVKFTYDEKILKTHYFFENVANPTDDLNKYIIYLIENNDFEIIQDFNTTKEVGNGKIAIKAKNKNDITLVMDFNWTKDSYELIFYKDKNNGQTLNNAS